MNEPVVVTVGGITYVDGIPQSQYTSGKTGTVDTSEKTGWQNFLSGLGTVLGSIFSSQRGTTQPVYTTPIQQPARNNSNIIIIALAVLVLLFATKTIKL